MNVKGGSDQHFILINIILPGENLPDPLVKARRRRPRISGNALYGGDDRNHFSTGLDEISASSEEEERRRRRDGAQALSSSGGDPLGLCVAGRRAIERE